MATKQRLDPEQPPTPEEVAELVRRIQNRSEGRLDVREHGAITVSDVAEASGASADIVRRHLEGIRAERALTSKTVRPKSQLPMLGLAFGLFVTAYAVYRFTPHQVTQAEMEEQLAQIKANRSHQPKKIHYPIEYTISEVVPPRSFTIEIRGQYTTTKVRTDNHDGRYLDVEHTRKQLAQALAVAYADAIQSEASAPRPDKPLRTQYRPGIDPNEDTLVALLGNSMIQMPSHVPAQATGGSEKWLADYADQTAKSVVEGLWRAQEMAYERNDAQRRSGFVSVPPGFNLTFAGRRANTFASSTFTVLPINPDKVVSKLLLAIQDAMEQDLKPPQFSTPEMRAGDAKIPIPQWSKVTIQGPMDGWSFNIPTAPSKQYPTAADVMAGAEKVLDSEMARLREKVVEFNRTGETTLDRP